jgi:hypothetical protein
MHSSLSVVLVAACCCSPFPGQVPEKRQTTPAFPVEMQVTAAKPGPDGTQKIAVTLTIKKDHWIFAHDPGLNELLRSRTSMTVTGEKTPKKVTIDYPKGKIAKDQVLGDYRIYTGKVRLEATVTRADGDIGHLLVAVRLHPFNEMVCNWLPTTLKQLVK